MAIAREWWGLCCIGCYMMRKILALDIKGTRCCISLDACSLGANKGELPLAGRSTCVASSLVENSNMNLLHPVHWLEMGQDICSIRVMLRYGYTHTHIRCAYTYLIAPSSLRRK